MVPSSAWCDSTSGHISHTFIQILSIDEQCGGFSGQVILGGGMHVFVNFFFCCLTFHNHLKFNIFHICIDYTICSKGHGPYPSRRCS